MSIEPSFSPGLRFRQALQAERPLQVVGTVNAYSALLARQAGFRAMSAAALKTFETLRRRGTQADVLENMQTRDELYDVLDYRSYERRLDALFANRD